MAKEEAWGLLAVLVLCVVAVDVGGLSLPDFERDTHLKYCSPNGGDCLYGRCSSVSCLHGKCGMDGSCVCDPCWVGKGCDSYVDMYRPRFLASEPFYVIPADASGVLLRVEASDDDLGLTCPLGPGEATTCPCAVTRYIIIGGFHQSLFRIDEETGDVFLKEGKRLIPGSDYRIRLQVSGLVSERGSNFTNSDFVDVTLHVEEKKSILDRGSIWLKTFFDRKSVSGRSKRQAPSVGSSQWSGASFSLTQTTSKLEASYGERLSYRIQMILPPIADDAAADFRVEMFTSDAESGATAFAICGPRMEYVGPDVRSKAVPDLTAVRPQMFQNGFFPTVYDRAVFTLQQVTNSGDGKSDGSKMSLTFDVVVVNANVTFDTPQVISAGAVFSGETYVWVGHDMVTPRRPASEDYQYKFILAEVGTVNQNDYKIISLIGTITDPSTPLTVVAYNPDGLQDIFSVSSIRVVSLGDNFLPCMPVSNCNYKQTFVRSQTDRSDSRGQLFIPLLNRIEADASVDSPGNKLELEVLIFLHEGIPEGFKFPLEVAVFVGDQKEPKWKGQVLVTAGGLSKTADSNAAEPVGISGVLITKPDVPPGAAFSFSVTVTLQPDSVTDLTVQATGVTGVVPCSIQVLQRGWNIPQLPPLWNVTEAAIRVTTVRLGLVKNTGRAPAEDTCANSITFHVSFSTTSSTPLGQKTITVTAGSQTFTGNINIAGNAITTQPEVAVVGGTPADMYLNSDWGMQLLVTLPEFFPKSQLSLDASGDPSVSDWGVRVCRIDVRSAGDVAPCLQNGVRRSLSLDQLVVSDICSSSGNVTSWQVVLDIAYELLSIPTPEALDSYKLNAALQVGGQKIWSEGQTVKVVPTQLTSYMGTTPPELITLGDIMSQNSGTRRGKIALVQFMLKMPKGARGTFSMEVKAAEELYLCRIRLLQVGYNYPCVESRAWWNEAPELSSTSIIYDEGSGRTAILQMDAMTNTGSSESSAFTEQDDNTIVVGAYIFILKNTAAGTYDVTATLNYGESDSITASQGVNVQEGLSLEENGLPQVSWFPILDSSTSVVKRVPKVLVMNITIPRLYDEQVEFSVTNLDHAEMPIQFCCAAIAFVGGNLPCVNATKVVPKYINGYNHMGVKMHESVNFNMRVCHYHHFEDEAENILQMEFTIRIPDEYSAKQTSLEVGMKTKDITFDAKSLPMIALSVVDKPTPTTGKGITVDVGPNSVAIPGRIQWIPLNIVLPLDSLAPLKITATTEAKNGRAIMTIRDFRVNQESSGIDVVCLDKTKFYIGVYKQNSTQIPNQNNVLELDMGYIANSGLARRQLPYYSRVHDDLVVEIAVQLTDHPANVAGATTSVDVTVDYGDTRVGAKKTFTVVRSDTRTKERADLTVDFVLASGDGQFQANDKVPLTATVWHSMNSRAEAIALQLRILKPVYMKYDEALASPTANTSGVTFTPNAKGYVDILIPVLYFADVVQVNFTLIVDPIQFPSKLSGPETATTVAIPLCQQEPFNNWPQSGQVIWCGEPSTALYEISNTDCFSSLGMQDPSVTSDCQLTASSAMDSSHMPSHARFNSGSFWVPVVRSFDCWKPYIQVDLGAMTRVTKLMFKAPVGYRYATKIEIQYSDLGLRFDTNDEAVILSGPEVDLKLRPSVAARFIRIVILEASGDPSEPVGLSMDLYGCGIQTRPPPPPCEKDTSTMVSTEADNWRHFVHNEKKKILYFCDPSPLRGQLCYASLEDGNWELQPLYLGGLIGYDKVKGKVYALDYQRRVYLVAGNKDGWGLIHENVVSNLRNSDNFVPMTRIPGFPQNDTQFPIDELSENWQADYFGLRKMESDTLSYNWIC